MFGIRSGVPQFFDSSTIKLGEKERISSYALAEKLFGTMDKPNSTRMVTSRGMMNSTGESVIPMLAEFM